MIPALLIRALLLTLGLLLCAVSNGCATAPVVRASDSLPEQQSEYYYGTTSTSSADGKVPYGPPVMSLVRRDVSPAEDVITETTMREGTTQVTTLRREEGGRFRASAGDDAFVGTIEFVGTEWQWTGWTSAIVLTDGGRIEASGRFDGKWMESEAFIYGANGERRRKVVNRLVRITAEEFAAKQGEMSRSATQPAAKQR